MGRRNSTVKVIHRGNITVPPNVVCHGKILSIPIKLLPELSAFSDGTNNSLFTHSRQVLASKNENGTYQIMNDIRLIIPELELSNPSHVQVIEPDFLNVEIKEQTATREFLAYIDTCRSTTAGTDFIIIASMRNSLKEVLKRYWQICRDPITFGKIRPLLLNSCPCESDFYRHKPEKDKRIRKNSNKNKSQKHKKSRKKKIVRKIIKTSTNEQLDFDYE